MATKTQDTGTVTNSTRRYDKFVVAIGASAGGLEAIHEFFDNMPSHSSLSFIVIQHLSSDYKSLLVELVSKHTHMKVFEAENNMTIQQNCVYIIPNNKYMTVSKGKLKLVEKNEIKSPNTAIDTFLHTLATDKKDKAIAIILSGTGTDGTKGIESIKECGGMVIVQDPATAKFDGMPNSAITSGNADFVLAPKKMHEELFNYINERPISVLENGKVDDGLLDEIFRLVYDQSGNDFNFYKTPTIIRRIGRRMNENGVKKLNEYVKYLHNNENEVKTLGKDFLIGVTKFFRDGQAFDILGSKVLSDIIHNKPDGGVLKIWVCACSTGEEAYSIAALANASVEKSGKNIEIKIFATDIDEASIEIASRNQYPSTISKEIPPELLKKYFVREGKYYSAIPSIRKQIVFAKHDVIKSPPFIKNDLVTCRNMLIYMNNLLQQKVLATFHFSLNQDGYLFLGSSETASAIKDGLIEVSGKWKIYKKSGYVNYSIHNYHTSSQHIGLPEKKKTQAQEAQSTIQKDFNSFLLNDLGYVGIYIDKAYIVQDAIGNLSNFLSLPNKIELNILKMVPHELSIVLNTGLRKAWKEEKKVLLKRIRVKRGKEDIYINISIRPPEKDSGKNYTLIILGESMLETLADKEEFALNATHSDDHTEYVTELEAELNETRNNLQMAVEEMETTNEELQSSNEELLSANEELQSSNEELQSLNEELHTLNTEHQVKIRELIELNDDLDNYFRTIDVGLIYLDSNLLIRKFNPGAVHMVNLIEADTGRSIEQISNNIRYENLTSDIRHVIMDGKMIEKEIQLKNGKRSLMRILPYVRKDKRIDGIVITFVDVSLITELNNLISGVFNASLSAIIAFSSIRNHDGHIIDFKCVTFNQEASSMLGKNAEDLTNAQLVKQLPELTEGNLFNKYVAVVEKGHPLQTEFQDNKRRWFQVVAVKMADGFTATYTDITDRKAAEQKLKRNFNELVSVRENLKKLNQELEDKVDERTRKLSESEERFTLVSQATNDTIWDWNLVSNTMWRSDNFTAMFGYHRNQDSESIDFWFKKIHPDDRKRVEQSVYGAINDHQQQWSAEYRFQKADGSYAIILDRGSILHDDFNTPYRMVGSIVDITRLIEAEKRVSTTESKFKKIFEANVIGMLFSDIESGRIEDANEVFLEMLGYSLVELKKHGMNWAKLTPPEFAEVSRKAIETIREKGSCQPFEKQYIRKDGTRVWVLIGSALLEGDYHNDAVTYVINITEQKEAERRRNELQRLVKKQQDEFYGIFKNAPALITIRRGNDLRYEFVNNAYREFDGKQDYIGRAYLEVHPEIKGTRLADIDKHVLKTGETFIAKAFKVERLANNGQNIDCWFDFIFTPVYSDKGDIDGIAFFGFDVTDLVRGQQATRELMQKKDEFMSIASHELKTPMTSIKGSLQIALRLSEKNKPQTEIMQFVEKANRQTDKLSVLVNDLLDVTKIQAGKVVLSYSKFSINELVNECVDETQNVSNGYKIVVNTAKDAEINADRNRVEQVISNLLSNAIKYSPGQSEVIISTEIKKNKLRVAVKDFGIGIPADKKDLVFDRFFRVQESSHKFSGLGLGLYISAEIIKRHHGKIGVDSEENSGSEFWFEIPVDSHHPKA